MAKFRKGQKVEWAWGSGYVKGTVQATYKNSVSRTIKGKRITRHGSTERPAYLLISDKGVDVLKLESELHPQD